MLLFIFYEAGYLLEAFLTDSYLIIIVTDTLGERWDNANGSVYGVKKIKTFNKLTGFS